MQSGLGCGHVDYAINYLLKTKLVMQPGDIKTF